MTSTSSTMIPGFTTVGGKLYSYGNNSVNGNPGGETFTATIGLK